MYTFRKYAVLAKLIIYYVIIFFQKQHSKRVHNMHRFQIRLQLRQLSPKVKSESLRES